MDYHSKTASEVLSKLCSSKTQGLDVEGVEKSKKTYGQNLITKKKPRSLIKKIISSLLEPMMLILLFGFLIAFFSNLAKVLAGGKGDFSECVGILLAIVLSISITLFMEGSSERAFRALDKIYDNVYVKVIRNGTVVVISQSSVVVGDIIILETGDKIVADGRLIECDSLSTDESALTGESIPVKKNASVVLNKTTHIAERVNTVYSGTYVVQGNGKMVVTAVGDKTEIGTIAKSLKDDKITLSPLQQKLSSLGKKITLMGVITAIVVFVISIVRLILTGKITFDGVQNLFISSIILIVAAVPEGLPTIVAVSLALNMIKLAKENALIKKMIATETTGAVSVICSDKTGTLTLNKMSVEKVCTGKTCVEGSKLSDQMLHKNFILNTTADVVKTKKEYVYHGSGTECALIVNYMKNVDFDYQKLRNSVKIIDRIPFNSKDKFMSTTVLDGEKRITYIKGAPEKIIPKCNLSIEQEISLFYSIEKFQKSAKRVLCFAHEIENKTTFDGYAVLSDKIRPEVKNAVKDCKTAGIKTMILTGDNYHTAYAVGVETGICDSEYQVINAPDLEKLSEEELKKILPKISVVARSTPSVKLKVVKALKDLGEVVAVTGDGVNDAPAIRHADVGIAMGRTGTEITKETADVILLDDSFSTIVRAVAFGRNVFRNLKRFITFQLSVNVSALIFITVCAIVGVESPFNTLQLLWINVIMDGPPALTLGLEKADGDLMKLPPVKRESPIVSKKTFIKILVIGSYVALVMILQYFFNFLKVSDHEIKGTIFTLFVLFQLFNAFNARELGSQSVLRRIGKNKVMLFTFLMTFLLQIILVSVFPNLFGISALSFISWIKIVGTSFSVIIVSEIYKWVYRRKVNKNQKKQIKTSWSA